jgi:CRISPR-associated endoribonuclease Cas6
MDTVQPAAPPLSILSLSLVPAAECRFRATPARSLRAALLRRLELLDPELTRFMHAANAGAAQNPRPWTVSSLLGPLERRGNYLVARPGIPCRVRVTALAPEVHQALHDAFLSDHPLAAEPLVLEGVPFQPVVAATRWEGPTGYTSLLTYARPQRRISLRFRSPTGFRQRDQERPEPTPELCLVGYLNRWNAFSEVSLPQEDLLDYARQHLRVSRADLRPANQYVGQNFIPGVMGWVEWESDGSEPALLRLVNALADYAVYCGTGVQTTQGMGQTERLP